MSSERQRTLAIIMALLLGVGVLGGLRTVISPGGVGGAVLLGLMVLLVVAMLVLLRRLANPG